jgi:OOP family OmpA-OmpF porin
MKCVKLIIGSLAIAFAGASFANDQWYLGATAGYYDQGNERAKYSDYKAANVGVQVGKYIADDIAIELGYGVNTGYDDFAVSSLNALKWLGDDSDEWRPYLLAGFNQYDFEETRSLVKGHGDKSDQMMFGLGLGKQLDDDMEFRADIRGMADIDGNDAQDIGLQVSFSKHFGK